MRPPTTTQFPAAARAHASVARRVGLRGMHQGDLRMCMTEECSKGARPARVGDAHDRRTFGRAHPRDQLPPV